MKSIIISLACMLFLGTIQAQAPVKWYTVEEAFALNKKEPRKIVDRCVYRLVQVVQGNGQ